MIGKWSKAVREAEIGAQASRDAVVEARTANRIASDANASAVSQAEASARETREALRHAETSAKAAADHVKIVSDAQRPWVTIRVTINHFIKSAESISISTNVSYENIGNIPAANIWTVSGIVIFKHGQDIKVDIYRRWSEWRLQRFLSPNVLMPNEIDLTQANFINHPINVKDGFFLVNVMAVAYYTLPGSDEWHATERAFNVALQLKPNLILSDYVTNRTPNKEIPLDEIRIRSPIAGETS